MLAVIYDQSGKVIAEAEAVLDGRGRPLATVELDAYRDAGIARGRLLGVSSSLARYELVELRTSPRVELDHAPPVDPPRRGRTRRTPTTEA